MQSSGIGVACVGRRFVSHLRNATAALQCPGPQHPRQEECLKQPLSGVQPGTMHAPDLVGREQVRHERDCQSRADGPADGSKDHRQQQLREVVRLALRGRTARQHAVRARGAVRTPRTLIVRQ